MILASLTTPDIVVLSVLIGLIVIVGVLIIVTKNGRTKKVSEKNEDKKSVDAACDVEPIATKEETVEEDQAPETITESETLEESTLQEELVEEEVSPLESKVSANEEVSQIEEPSKQKAEETNKYTGKYEVYSEGNFYKYRLKASNGEVLVVSQMYSSEDSVYRSIDSVKRNVEQGIIRVIKDKRGMYKFKLIAKNHRAIVISSTYTSENSVNNAINSFKRFALSAITVKVEVCPEQLDSTSIKIDVDKSVNKDGGKYVITKDPDLDWCWELKASNGEVLCSGEGYTTKSGAQNAIENFKENIVSGDFYVVKDKRDRYQFKLMSTQRRIVALGETYQTKNAAISAANSVCAFYKNAELK